MDITQATKILRAIYSAKQRVKAADESYDAAPKTHGDLCDTASEDVEAERWVARDALREAQSQLTDEIETLVSVANLASGE